ncbi:phosphoenolpyruvate--protein phosphotransferase [Shewanella maritima]|uniref:phosphoenolpyruvate--protein phosphotransferase n=1 Tax=Shewanella maritima TaxID=2520507 RepID=UPI003734D713
MLTSLRDITQSVASADSFEAALTTLVSQTKEAMETQCCSIYILEQQQLILSATDGLAQSAVGYVAMPLSQGLVGLAAEREELVNLADARIHPRFQLFPQANEEEYRAFLAAPIIYQKCLVGVIVIQQGQARQFNESEEAFLMTLAAQIASMVRGFKRKARLNQQQSQVIFNGTSASPGIAIAKGLVLGGEISIEQPELHCQDIELEVARLLAARDKCIELLKGIAQRLEQDKATEVASIFNAFTALLDEHSLGGEYLALVKAGWRAETAVSKVSLQYINQFAAMQDVYLQERASDIRELGHKMLRQLIEPNKLAMTLDEPVVLISKEVDATLLAELPSNKLAGIVTQYGGVNAHTAILARALNIPAVVAVEDIFSADIEQKQLIVNASRGQILVSPSKSVVAEYQALLDADIARQKRFVAELSQPTLTLDSYSIQLYLNAGLLTGLESQIGDGADGIGLYRTEIPFMLHQGFPSEAEQITVYRRILAAASGKSVVMRTLDIGGDKPLPYFPINEDNPFLGWRGIRFSLDHPELFLVQLRAMLQASANSEQLHVLLPMVSNIEEVDQAIAYLDQALNELNQDLGLNITRPKIGIMLEIPALLFQIPQVASRVDFISVGSNDLTQYLLAVDRNNPSVSSLFDSFHPGVLRALKLAVTESEKYQLDISICGELAGEPIGALLLVAMGYNKLSMNQASLARINYLLRRVHRHELQGVLSQVLTLDDAYQVKAVMHQFIAQRGFDDVIQ